MNVALRQRKRLTVPEFIEMIRPRPDEERWELLDGEAVLMSPQSERHQRIVTNLLRRCDELAEPRGCVALAGLRMVSDAADDYAPIPDVVVRCGPLVEGGYAKDPVLVAEVLSPSTMTNDRGRKLDFYKGMASLQTLLLIYQDEMRVESWTRVGAEWQFAVLSAPGAAIPIRALDAEILLSDLYRRISFG